MVAANERARRKPADVLRGLIPWPPLPHADHADAALPGPPLILEGPAITSLLPYDRPEDFVSRVYLYPGGKLAEAVHVVDPARCQGYRFNTPLLPGSTLGDVLYVTFGVLLCHSPLLPPGALAGKIGVRARDEDFRYRRRVPPGAEVTVGVELLGRRGDLLAAHGWATAGGETVFEARRCWIGLLPRDEGARRP